MRFGYAISILMILVLLFAGGCASPGVSRPARPAPPPPPREAAPLPAPALPPETVPAPEPAPPPPPRETRPAEPTPRMVASLRLTEEAKILLESGKTDQAIRTLERAMNMSPSNGHNFYYLSEAWLVKKNTRQAEEFNRLAALYLKSDPQWASRVAEQAERIRAAKER